MDMNLEARAVDVDNLQIERCMESEAQAIDGGEGDSIGQGGSGFEETMDFLDTEDGGQAVFGLRAHERQGMPVLVEDVLVEELDAPGADTHGRWSEAIDVIAV
jgi:hypothetical protein